jgi:Zn-dependent oligopeptidase
MLYDYTRTTAAGVARITDDAIAAANHLIDAIATHEGPNTIENTLLPLNESAAIIEAAYGQGAFMARVHPDSACRLQAPGRQ